KSAPGEAPAQRALSRITDVHMLGSIARHAVHESVRRAALAGVHDRAEILHVALNSEFRDTAVEAVERLSERDDLDEAANRARNRSAAKRARALVRDMDDRAAAEAAAAAAPAPVAPEPAPAERPAREADEREEAAARERAERAERQHAEEEAAERVREEREAAERARLHE